MSETRINLYGVSIMVPAVVMVVKRNKADTHKREYLVQVSTYLDIVPWKEKHVFYTDTADGVFLYLLM